MRTKDKIIIKHKNQNSELTSKIVKIKCDHDQALQVAKSEVIALKGEVDMFKAQVNVKAKKKITELEAKVV